MGGRVHGTIYPQRATVVKLEPLESKRLRCGPISEIVERTMFVSHPANNPLFVAPIAETMERTFSALASVVWAPSPLGWAGMMGAFGAPRCRSAAVPAQATTPGMSILRTRTHVRAGQARRLPCVGRIVLAERSCDIHFHKTIRTSRSNRPGIVPTVVYGVQDIMAMCPAPRRRFTPPERSLTGGRSDRSDDYVATLQGPQTEARHR